MAQLDLSLDPVETLKKRLMTAEDAAKLVKSGDQLWSPSAHICDMLLAALVGRMDELENVKIRSTMVPDMGWFREEARKHFDIQVQYAILPDNRQALADKVIDFHPYHMIMQHKAIDAGRPEAQQIDKHLIVVSEPNEHGYVCVGNACWDAVSNASRAKMVLAEMNANQPRTCGDSWLHVSQLDAIVRNDKPRLALPPPTEFDPIDRALAANVRTLIHDRATIQVGLGSHTGVLAPLGAFDDAEDLTYFGELTVPGLVDLVRQGRINGKYGALHPGKMVAAHIGNTVDEIAYIEENPAFELRSYEYTNDPRNIAAHEEMIAINGALMVDLTGQIGVYAFGPEVYTGLGGHLGFAIGATLAPRGRYVTLLPSTARGGTVSTIVPLFEKGQIVSIPRELADTIVTEHGIARLLGLSVRERTRAMIEVAHPDHRADLRKAARQLYG